MSCGRNDGLYFFFPCPCPCPCPCPWCFFPLSAFRDVRPRWMAWIFAAASASDVLCCLSPWPSFFWPWPCPWGFLCLFCLIFSLLSSVISVVERLALDFDFFFLRLPPPLFRRSQECEWSTLWILLVRCCSKRCFLKAFHILNPPLALHNLSCMSLPGCSTMPFAFVCSMYVYI
mgnify:FL=1